MLACMFVYNGCGMCLCLPLCMAKCMSVCVCIGVRCVWVQMKAILVNCIHVLNNNNLKCCVLISTMKCIVFFMLLCTCSQP